MWPYPWTHVRTPSHLGHMDRVAATMPSQAHAGAAQEAPDIGQWEGQDVPLVRPSSCNVKGGIPSSRRYLPTSVCVHSVYDEQVGLPSPLTAEVQFVDCVISARFSVGRKIQSRRRQLLLHRFTLTCPPVKRRLMSSVSGGGTKPASTYYTLLRLTYHTLSFYRTTSKQA